MIFSLAQFINAPAFSLCAALLLFLAAVAACVMHRVAVLRPGLSVLRRVRIAVGDLREPRISGAVTPQAWHEARQALGTLLQRHATFHEAWVTSEGESLRRRGVPGRPFSSFVATEPSDVAERDDAMRPLSGSLISLGAMLTALGLAIAFYLASKGFRSDDPAVQKLAIVELLDAIAFKLLIIFSALLGAFVTTLFERHGRLAIRRERQRTLDRIEGYLAAWRERVDADGPGEAPGPPDASARSRPA